LSQVARFSSHVGSRQKNRFSVVSKIDVVGDVLAAGRRVLLDNYISTLANDHLSISVVENWSTKTVAFGDQAETQETVELS
jgi:hypothetical protein